MSVFGACAGRQAFLGLAEQPGLCVDLAASGLAGSCSIRTLRSPLGPLAGQQAFGGKGQGGGGSHLGWAPSATAQVTALGQSRFLSGPRCTFPSEVCPSGQDSASRRAPGPTPAKEMISHGSQGRLQPSEDMEARRGKAAPRRSVGALLAALYVSNPTGRRPPSMRDLKFTSLPSSAVMNVSFSFEGI